MGGCEWGKGGYWGGGGFGECVLSSVELIFIPLSLLNPFIPTPHHIITTFSQELLLTAIPQNQSIYIYIYICAFARAPESLRRNMGFFAEVRCFMVLGSWSMGRGDGR